ncbi:MAG: hypothetical protein ACJAZO_004928 [Myxococcota bacterium]|jgi:hypothetical protein
MFIPGYRRLCGSSCEAMGFISIEPAESRFGPFLGHE